MKFMSSIARDAAGRGVPGFGRSLAGLALLACLCAPALAGNGPGPGGPAPNNLVPGEDITSLPVFASDGGFSFTGRAGELRELLGAAVLRGAARVERLGGGEYAVILEGDAQLVLERERLARTDVRIGFHPGRLFHGDAARLVLWGGADVAFRAEDIALPVSRMAQADAVQGIGIAVGVLGPSQESFRGVIRFSGERATFVQRIALGG
jgi:hypothetical protein